MIDGLTLDEEEYYNLGYHDTQEQAALAYNRAALMYFGEFARLNEVENVIG